MLARRSASAARAEAPGGAQRGVWKGGVERMADTVGASRDAQELTEKGAFSPISGAVFPHFVSANIRTYRARYHVRYQTVIPGEFSCPVRIRACIRHRKKRWYSVIPTDTEARLADRNGARKNCDTELIQRDTLYRDVGWYRWWYASDTVLF